MTIDEIRDALASSGTVSEEIIRRAVAAAPALAPAVIELVRKVADGVCLMPREEDLLFRGLYVLAQARETSVHQPLLSLLRQPVDVVDRLLGDAVTADLRGILLATFDGDAEPMLAMIVHRTTEDTVAWALVEVLARLAFDGAVPVDRLRTLLDEIDGEQLFDDHSIAWSGWRTAVALLGLTDMADRVRASFADGRLPEPEVEVQGWEEEMQGTLAAPGDPARFAGYDLEPLADAAAALARLDWRDPGPLQPALNGRPDPAACFALSGAEIGWLAAFLSSRHVPPDAASIEEMDGLFSAIVAGPVAVPAAEWMPVLMGDAGYAAPDYAGTAQAELVQGLLDRHLRTIEARLAAGYPHFPLLDAADGEETASFWALGFVAGMEIREDAWDALLNERKKGLLLASILALGPDETDAEPLVGKEREEVLDTLPLLLVAVWNYWHGGAQPAARHRKVGRNERCPCGSGRKFKVCCGAAVPRMPG